MVRPLQQIDDFLGRDAPESTVDYQFPHVALHELPRHVDDGRAMIGLGKCTSSSMCAFVCVRLDSSTLLRFFGTSVLRQNAVSYLNLRVVAHLAALQPPAALHAPRLRNPPHHPPWSLAPGTQTSQNVSHSHVPAGQMAQLHHHTATSQAHIQLRPQDCLRHPRSEFRFQLA